MATHINDDGPCSNCRAKSCNNCEIDNQENEIISRSIVALPSERELNNILRSNGLNPYVISLYEQGDADYFCYQKPTVFDENGENGDLISRIFG